MNISNSVKNDIRQEIDLPNEKKKEKSVEIEKVEVDKKDKKPKIDVVAIVDAKQEGLNKLLKGKTSKVLDNLNKQKVTTENLKEAVDKLKDNKDKDEVKNDKEKIDKKAKKIIDKMDLNKDGKISPQKVKSAKEKLTLNLVKDLIGELKKDKDEVHQDKFKNIVKMINDDLVGGKSGTKINKFLDN